MPCHYLVNINMCENVWRNMKNTRQIMTFTWIGSGFIPKQAQLSQGIINHPIHGEMVRPRCMACPGYHAGFKKKFDSVNVVMFGNIIFVMGSS